MRDVFKGFFVLCMVLLWTVTVAESGEEVEPDVLQALIDEALANNPEIKSFEAQVSAAAERPPRARSLENPRLKLGLMSVPVDTWRFDEWNMTQKTVSIMQKFPFPGKLALREETAKQELAVTKERLAEKRNAVRMNVKTRYFRLLFLRTALDVTDENLTLLREFVKIAETKYSVGKGIQQDVLKAQVELSRMLDRRLVFEKEQRTAIAALNTLLDRPASAPLEISGDVPETRNILPETDLIARAEQSRPLLNAARHMIARNETQHRLAEKDYFPDPDIGITYAQRDDGPTRERADFVSASVTFKLPVFFRNREARVVGEAKARVLDAERRYDAARNEVGYRISELLSEITRYNEEIDLFRTGLIPQSRASLDSALSGYEVNKVDFLTLVTNQLTLYNLELEFYRAVSEREVRIAQLEFAVGAGVTAGGK